MEGEQKNIKKMKTRVNQPLARAITILYISNISQGEVSIGSDVNKQLKERTNIQASDSSTQ